MTRRRNASDIPRELPNVFPNREAFAPGEEFDAPDNYPWGDPIGWDEEIWPVVKAKATASKSADKE